MKVKPLDYTPEKKKTQTNPITPDEIIDYCLSTIGATSFGEIYNIHATIVDLNLENHPQRTCQSLAIELAKMFSAAGSLFFCFPSVDYQRKCSF